jgi:chromosomal replication initiation ATPase DnaA
VSPAAVWAQVREALAREIHPAPFEQWIDPLAPVAIENDRLVITASHRVVNWVLRRYALRIAELVRELSPLAGIVVRAPEVET